MTSAVPVQPRARTRMIVGMADRLLGHGAVRILAYHGVDDVDGFERQMRRVATEYTPVRAHDVVAAVGGGEPLPDRAVWVTFDDGLPSVVHQGQAILDDVGIEATLFVCPGLIESGLPNWWDVVAAACSAGIPLPAPLAALDAPRAVTALKSTPDAERREVVETLTEALRAAGVLPAGTQLTADDLAAWATAGHVLGNHSWDHPCLDRCTPAAQREQIARTDAWLRTRFPGGPRLFAYPNGNATATVEESLTELGYDLALVFDHHVARIPGNRMRVSRLRVSSTASDDRFAAILSGAHSAGYHVKRRVLRLTDHSAADRGDEGPPAAADDHNRSVYETREVVEQFSGESTLTPCEQHLFATYVQPGAEVLDLGVGGGRTVPPLVARASRYVGIDYSAGMIAAARDAHPGVDLRLGDAADLGELGDGSFDVVVFSFNGLDYLHPRAKRARCIEEMGRVLRPGGVAILSEHNARAMIRPRPPEGSVLRSLVVQAYVSARLLARALPSRAFWAGEGELRDTATQLVNYTTVPRRIWSEFLGHGLVLEQVLGARYPARANPIVEPWYYYAFRRA